MRQPDVKDYIMEEMEVLWTFAIAYRDQGGDREVIRSQGSLLRYETWGQPCGLLTVGVNFLELDHLVRDLHDVRLFAGIFVGAQKLQALYGSRKQTIS